jgi:hypothetical protein
MYKFDEFVINEKYNNLFEEDSIENILLFESQYSNIYEQSKLSYFVVSKFKDLAKSLFKKSGLIKDELENTESEYTEKLFKVNNIPDLKVKKEKLKNLNSWYKAYTDKLKIDQSATIEKQKSIWKMIRERQKNKKKNKITYL